MESSGSEIAGGRRRQRVVEAMRPLTEIFELNRRLPVWRPTQRPTRHLSKLGAIQSGCHFQIARAFAL
jgi:hypothetical protein